MTCNIKMLALDLDETTLRSDKSVSEKNLSAIRKAAEKGVIITVATGRPRSAVPSFIDGLGCVRYFICSNGASVYDENGDQIYGKMLAPSAVKACVDLVKGTGLMFESFSEGLAYISQDFYDQMKNEGCSYRTSEYVLKTRTPVPDIFSFTLENRDRIENLNVFFPDQEIKASYYPKLKSIRNATLTSSFPSNYELGGVGVSKADALKEVMKIERIKSSGLMAMGDSPNDITMLELAEHSGAVANATEDVKKAAKYVFPANYEDGVAEAIEELILKE